MRRIIILSFGLLVYCSEPRPDPRATLLDEFLTGQAEHFRFNGTVLVAEGGNILYQNAFGLADYSAGRLLNDSSVFELASVSKQFTAMAILILKERGLLSLSDSLRQYFPELPYPGITLHHLLTHTSGVPDYESLTETKWDHTKIAFNADMIALLASEKPPVHFAPGKRWEYSNTGFMLLASVVEKVSGKSFGEYMEENIFSPIGMRYSRVYNTRRSGELLTNYAYGFVWSDSLDRFVLPDSLPAYDMVYYLDGIQGDGIINSTTADLLTWDRALAASKLVSEASMKEMLAPHALRDTVNNAHYGYGIGTGKNQLGSYISHSGGWPGYATNLTRYLEGDRTIVVLSNNESAAGAISSTLAHILFDQPVILPSAHTAIELDSAGLSLFTGTYSIRGSKAQFSLDPAGRLQVSVFGQQFGLLPESASKVFCTDYIDLQFERDSEGRLFRVLYGVREELERE